jgi:hypothetical protein
MFCVGIALKIEGCGQGFVLCAGLLYIWVNTVISKKVQKRCVMKYLVSECSELTDIHKRLRVKVRNEILPKCKCMNRELLIGTAVTH